MEKQPIEFPKKIKNEMDPAQLFAVRDLRLMGPWRVEGTRTSYHKFDASMQRVCIEVPVNKGEEKYFAVVNDKEGSLMRVPAERLNNIETIGQLVKQGIYDDTSRLAKYRDKGVLSGSDRDTFNFGTRHILDLNGDMGEYARVLARNPEMKGLEPIIYPMTYENEFINRDQLFELAGAVRHLSDEKLATINKSNSQEFVSKETHEKQSAENYKAAEAGYGNLFEPVKKAKLTLKGFFGKEDKS